MVNEKKSEVKMVKIPKEEYDKLRAAQEEIMKKGTKKLPENVGDTIKSLGIGAMIGAGSLALMYLLSKEEKSEKRGKK